MSIFCEVLDVRENCGIEEVYVVYRDVVYNCYDEVIYDVYFLKDFERIVIDNIVYMQCKVYVKDVRLIDEFLLNNGVVDIVFIDVFGFNMDIIKIIVIFV